MTTYRAQLLNARFLGKNQVEVTVRCPIDGKEYSRVLNTSIHKIMQWFSHVYDPDFPKIQDFFHELSVDDREFILTGLDEGHWDQLMGEEK